MNFTGGFMYHLLHTMHNMLRLGSAGMFMQVRFAGLGSVRPAVGEECMLCVVPRCIMTELMFLGMHIYSDVALSHLMSRSLAPFSACC